MLSRTQVITGHLVVLVVLVALVALFTDRSAFAWALACAVFVAGLVSDVVVRTLRSRRAPK